MLIKKRSTLTGKLNEMELDVTQQQLDAFYGGMLVQQAFPNLNADEREFILSGCTVEEWNLYMGEDVDEDV